MFACCAALRLARFNVETDSDDEHTMFAGLPTPAAAATIASFAILSYTLRNEVAVVTHENFIKYDWWMQRLRAAVRRRHFDTHGIAATLPAPANAICSRSAIFRATHRDRILADGDS